MRQRVARQSTTTFAANLQNQRVSLKHAERRDAVMDYRAMENRRKYRPS